MSKFKKKKKKERKKKLEVIEIFILIWPVASFVLLNI